MGYSQQKIEIDIPCDVQQEDESGFVWAFLDEARDPSVITVGAIVIAADDQDPVLAKVVSIDDGPGGTKVRLDILPADPREYVQALSRAHLLTA